MTAKTQNAGKATICPDSTHHRVNGAAPLFGSPEVAATSMQGYCKASSGRIDTAKTGEGQI